jgi:Phage integrase family
MHEVTFHALRHTSASILIAQGRDAVFVADQLGHEHPAFTWRTSSTLSAPGSEPRLRAHGSTRSSDTTVVGRSTGPDAQRREHEGCE